MDDDVATRKTYRYVRIGMVGATVLLGTPVLIEHNTVEPACWQTSISAYYYSPVRAVFVGALMAIGLSLIVIKGSTWPEDVCLNVAGMLAPVVALVPTADHGTCWSVEPIPLPTVPNPSGDDQLAGSSPTSTTTSRRSCSPGAPGLPPLRSSPASPLPWAGREASPSTFAMPRRRTRARSSA
jgi:hypothetical protein